MRTQCSNTRTAFGRSRPARKSWRSSMLPGCRWRFASAYRSLGDPSPTETARDHRGPGRARRAATGRGWFERRHRLRPRRGGRRRIAFVRGQPARAPHRRRHSTRRSSPRTASSRRKVTACPVSHGGGTEKEELGHPGIGRAAQQEMGIGHRGDAQALRAAQELCSPSTLFIL